MSFFIDQRWLLYSKDQLPISMPTNSLLSQFFSLVADFGFSLDMGLAVAPTPCGSYSYAAPELFAYAGLQNLMRGVCEFKLITIHYFKFEKIIFYLFLTSFTAVGSSSMQWCAVAYHLEMIHK